MAIAFAHANDLPRVVAENVRAALAEDVGETDITAELIDAERHATAQVISREPGVFCGAPWIVEVCAQVDGDIEVEFEIADGDAVRAWLAALSEISVWYQPAADDRTPVSVLRRRAAE